MILNQPESIPMPTSRSAERLLSTANWAPDPRLLLRWIILDWGIIGAAWATMAMAGQWWVTVIGCVVVASRLHALGAILHDACHRQRRPHTRLWWLVEALAGWPITSTIEAMRYHHLRHHAAAGTPKDPYHGTVRARTALLRYALSLRGAILPFWWTLRAVIAPFVLLFPSIRTAYGRAFLQDRSGENLRDNAAVIACARADIAQLAAQTIVLGAAFAAGLPVLTYYIAPLILAGVLNARRVVYEHSWTSSEQRTRRQTWDTTVDHDLGLVGNAVFYPHNIGLHRIHHMYPAVSFVHLRELADAVRRDDQH